MQNYKNHRQIVVSYHIFTWLGLLALLAGSIRNFVYSTRDNLYSSSLLVLVSVLLISIALHARKFGLIAQDRAIRAEENLRYFMLTGKPMDSRITLKQIIALRFASDEELPALAQRAVDEKLSNIQIKKLIRTWRPDTHRV
ncbi:MAG TPA: DUF6526 family protein [Chitinophagaceae bacterium]|nr:DUF6526 family protein [Chitinophagaceae bacterium]